MSFEASSVLPETVAEQLRASILDQTDPPGSTVTESTVALRYGVARPTARMAIERLVADGVLRREAHRAARVPELSRDDIVDLYDNRAVIEATASAALAQAGAIPAEALAAHRALAAAARGGQPFARDDITFHRALVTGQPSPRLARMHSMLMGEIELGIGQVQAANLMTGTEVAAQHQAILDAITAGHVERSAALAREHIVGARDRLLRRWDEQHLAPPKGR